MLLVKPMLSADLAKVNNDFDAIEYPVLASPKLDGLRCIISDGIAYSRNGEPFRNRAFQAAVIEKARFLEGLDGEVVVGPPTDPHCLNNTQSGIMSFEGEPDFKFYAFDWTQAIHCAFVDRLRMTEEMVEKARSSRTKWVELLQHTMIYDAQAMRDFENLCVQQGYEGIMFRDPEGRYKQGRATLKSGWLTKCKRFTDGEAVVIAFEEGTHNENDAERDALGRTKRSRASAALKPSGMVGTLIAKDPKWGVLRVAPGKMPHAMRRDLFLNPKNLLGRRIHWRSFGYGVKDKPRFPRFYAFV
jgi:DNA ligase 1